MTNPEFFKIYENLKQNISKPLSIEEHNKLILMLCEKTYFSELQQKQDKEKEELLKSELNQQESKNEDNEKNKLTFNKEVKDALINETSNQEKNSKKLKKTTFSGVMIADDKVTKHPIKGIVTICSSVATTGNVIRDENDVLDTSGKKAALFGTADDAQNVNKLFMSLGKNYICKGNYVFSQDSISSVTQDNFLTSVKNYFNSSDIDCSIIYYSGHGFPDATLLFETSQGNYHVSYSEIISLWRKRNHPKKNKYLLLILDCCYSGSWVRKLIENGDFYDVFIQASSTQSQKSLDLGLGKGSLFTNAFLYVNLKDLNLKKGSAAISSEFSFDTVDMSKLSSQSPRGVVFDDIKYFTLNIAGINANSWLDMGSKAQEELTWKTKEWESTVKDKHNKIAIQKIKLDISKGIVQQDSYPHLLFCFKEELFTCQGEFTYSNNEGIEERVLVRISFNSEEIKKQFLGFSAIYQEDEDTDSLIGKYFNHAAKKILGFERSREEIEKVISSLIAINSLIFNDITNNTINNSYNTEKLLNNELLTIFSTLTLIDKSCLIEEEDDNEENDHDNDIDIYEEIGKLKTSNSNIREIGVNSVLNPSVFNGIANYICSNESEIDKISICVDKSTSNLECLGKSTASSISVNFLSCCNLNLLQSLEYLNNKKELFIGLDQSFRLRQSCDIGITKSIAYEKLLLADKLQVLEFKNFIPYYNYVLPYFANIKTLKHFGITDYPLNSLFSYDTTLVNNITNNTTNSNSNSNNNENDLTFIVILKAFYGNSELKSIKFSNCKIENCEKIVLNPNLISIDLSNNFISHLDIPYILTELNKFNNKYTINLSSNLINHLVFPQVKSFLCKNPTCTEFNLSNNEIDEADMLQFTKYSILQNNNILDLDLSGTKFSFKTLLLTEIIKKTKMLKSLKLRDCDLKNSVLAELCKTLVNSPNNSITSVDFSNNKVDDFNSAKIVLMSLKYSNVLTVVCLNNVFDVVNSTTDIDLYGFFKNPVLEEFYFADNHLNKHNFTIKGEEASQNLKRLSFKNTNFVLNTVNSLKGISLELLEIDDVNLNVSVFSKVKILNLNVVSKLNEVDKSVTSFLSKVESVNLITTANNNNSNNSNNSNCNNSNNSNNYSTVDQILEESKLFSQGLSKQESYVDSNFKLSVERLIAEEIDEEAMEFLNSGIFLTENTQLSLKSKESNNNNFNKNKLTITSDSNQVANNSNDSVVLIENTTESNSNSNKNQTEIEEKKHFIQNNISTELVDYLKSLSLLNTKVYLSEIFIANNPFIKLNTSSKYVILNNNYFDVDSFCDSSTLSTVEYLELNSVSLKHFMRILKEVSVHLVSLKVLVIKNSEVRNKELLTLLEVLAVLKNSLIELHLINNYLDSKDAKSLFSVVSSIKNLRTINLSYNSVNNNFVSELVDYLSMTPSIEKIILRACCLSELHLMKICSKLSINADTSTSTSTNTDTKSLKLLDISNLEMKREATIKSTIENKIINTTNTNTNTSNNNTNTNIKPADILKNYKINVSIGYSNTVFIQPFIDEINSIVSQNINSLINLKNSDKQNSIEITDFSISNVNLNQQKNKLFDLFKQISTIHNFKISQCKRESTAFYVLKELILVTSIVNLDVSNSLISASNVEDLIEIIENQCKKGCLKSVAMNNCEMQDAEFIKLLYCLERNNVFYASLRNNKFTKSSICVMENVLKRVESKNNFANFDLKHSFSANFDNRNNQKVHVYLTKKDKNILKNDNIITTSDNNANSNFNFNLNDRFTNASSTVISTSKSISFIEEEKLTTSEAYCDGKNEILVTGASNGELKLWNSADMKLLQLRKFESPIVQLLLLVGRFAVFSQLSELRVLDFSNQEDKDIMSPHLTTIASIQRLSEKRFISISSDGVIAVWNYSECLKGKITVESVFNIKALTSISNTNINNTSSSNTSSSNYTSDFEIVGMVVLENKNLVISCSNNAIIRLSLDLDSENKILSSINTNSNFNSNLSISTSLDTRKEEENVTNLCRLRGSKVMYIVGKRKVYIHDFTTNTNILLFNSNSNTETNNNTHNKSSSSNISETSILDIRFVCEIFIVISLSNSKNMIYYDTKINKSNTDFKYELVKTVTTFLPIYYNIQLDLNQYIAVTVKNTFIIQKVVDFTESNLNPYHTLNVNSLCRLDNDTFASGSADNSIKIFKVSSYSCIATLTGHSSYVKCLLYENFYKESSNSKILVSGSWDYTIKLWEIKDNDDANSSDDNDNQIKYSRFYCSATLIGHKKDVNALMKVKDEYLISASEDKTFIVWSLRTKNIITSIVAHKYGIFTLSLFNESENNNTFLSGSDDQTIKLWSFESILNAANTTNTTNNTSSSNSSNSCSPIQEFSGHRNSVFHVLGISSTRFVSCSADDNIMLWDINSSTALQTIEGQCDVNITVKLDDKRIIVADDWTNIRVFDISFNTGSENSMVLIFKLEAHYRCSVKAITLLFNNNTADTNNAVLVTAGTDKQIKIWEIKYTSNNNTNNTNNTSNTDINNETNIEFNLRNIFSGHLKDIDSFSQLTDTNNHIVNNDTMTNTNNGLCKNLLASISREEIFLWDISTQNKVKSFKLDFEGENYDSQTKEHCKYITSVLSINSSTIATSSYYKSIILWNIESEECVGTLLGHTNSIQTLIKIDDTRIASGADWDEIRIWCLTTMTCIAQSSSKYQVQCMGLISKDLFAIGVKDHHLRVFRVDNCEFIATLTEHTQNNSLTCVNKLDESSFASCDNMDGIIVVWGWNQTIKAIKGDNDTLDIASSSDKVGHSNNELFEFSKLGKLEKHPNSLYGVFLLDDDLIVAGGFNWIKLWRRSLFKCVLTIYNRGSYVRRLLKPLYNNKDYVNSDFFISADREEIKYWHRRDFICTRVAESSNKTMSICDIDDEKFAISASDNSIKILNRSTQECLASMTGHKGAVSLLVNVDSEFIASLSTIDCTLRYWNIKTYTSSYGQSIDSNVYFVNTMKGSKRILMYTLSEKLVIWDVCERGSQFVNVKLRIDELREICCLCSDITDVNNYLKMKQNNNSTNDNSNNESNNREKFSLNDTQELIIRSSSSFSVNYKNSNLIYFTHQYSSYQNLGASKDTSNNADTNINNKNNYLKKISQTRNSISALSISPKIKHFFLISNEEFIIALDNNTLEFWSLLTKSCMFSLKLENVISCISKFTEDVLLIGSYKKIYALSIIRKKIIQEIDIGINTEVLEITVHSESSFMTMDSNANFVSWLFNGYTIFKKLK